MATNTKNTRDPIRERLTEKYDRYMKLAYEELKDKPLSDIAKSFKEMYEQLQDLGLDTYLKVWFLAQAPISIIAPHPELTAFATNTGRIFINPVFINALYIAIEEKVEEEKLKYHLRESEVDSLLSKYSQEALTYIITHEMNHILLKHVFNSLSIYEMSGLPIYLAYPLANIIQDYLINVNICNPLYESIIKETQVLSPLIISTKEFEKALESFLVSLVKPDVVRRIKEKLSKIHETEGLDNKTWEEIFFAIAREIDVKKDLLPLPEFLYDNSSGNSSSASGGGFPSLPSSPSKTAKGKEESNENNKGSTKTIKVKDAHGNEYEFNENEVEDITDGYLEDLKEKKENEETKGQGQGQGSQISKDQGEQRGQEKQGSQGGQASQSQEGQENQGGNNSGCNTDLNSKKILEDVLNKWKGQKEKLSRAIDNLRDEMEKHKAIEEALERLVSDYVRQLKQAGFGQGGIYRQITDMLQVNTTSLQKKLQICLSKQIVSYKVLSSWARVNRRNPGVMPGIKKDDKDKNIVFFCDVSGSMSEPEISVAISTLRELLNRKAIKSAVLCTFDDGATGVFDVKKLTDLKQVKDKIIGGGGTRLIPAIQGAIENDKINYGKIVMVMTDSELTDETSDVAEIVKKINKITGNKVFWIHLNIGSSTNSLKQIVSACQNTIIPLIVDYANKKVYVKDFEPEKKYYKKAQPM